MLKFPTSTKYKLRLNIEALKIIKTSKVSNTLEVFV